MPEGPRIYSIAAHRGVADALVAGLVPRYGDAEFGLARLTLLLPGRRTVRTVTEAFVRHSGEGLLLPRMAVVGDLDLDEALGSLLDPLGASDIPPAADPTRRWLRLAAYLREVEGEETGSGAALLRRAFELGRTMDRLLVEGIAPIDLMSERIRGIVGEHAEHWTDATRTFLMVQQLWIYELAERGEVDAPERRNLLFEHAARRWRETPPAGPVVAAGVTSASPALARLLRVVSQLPQGAVILPDLDLALDAETWDELGTAGAPEGPEDPHFAPGDAVTHPQYHLKLLLNRMGVAREEVRTWHRSGTGAAPPERSRAISNLFLPPQASARWVTLGPDQRRLAGVRLMESAHPGAEAQAIALLMREALDVPERRVCLVTPDRALAGRVVAHLTRWGIDADDSAGQPLAQTAAGRAFLLLAELVAENAAPVPLLALLSHPLVHAGEPRAEWLRAVRRLDRAMRGPRRGVGLAAIEAPANEAGVRDWWAETAPILAAAFPEGRVAPLPDVLDRLTGAIEALCGEGVWAGPDGRALAAFVEELRVAAADAGTSIGAEEIHAVLRDAMERVSVRPPWGGHPRVAIYGLLEARMARADLVICGGLVEGAWPASHAQDALLPPAVLRALGVPGGDFRIGLAAHDLAAALGAPDVVLSWAGRDESGPVIPSRFVLRVKALLGELAGRHREDEMVRLARDVDDGPRMPAHPRPQPMPSAAQRQVSVSATALDRLRSDPYQFYAGTILRLSRLDSLDAEPSAAWKGELAHRIMERWHEADEPPDGLEAIAREELEALSAHPLMRVLWWPRLSAALDTFREEVLAAKDAGRVPLLAEKRGAVDWRGVTITARVDRIDRLADGTCAIVDYKTGSPPSDTQVAKGYSLQLGTIGLIARAGGFETLRAEPSAFEYWSLGKKAGAFGYVQTPLKIKGKRGGVEPDEFLPMAEDYLDQALDQWILGDDPFTARLNPDLPSYADYDQLMRLDEWFASLGDMGGDDAP
ncbi:PD-(D/E)XK nuclease family protein [Novosphingobium aquimarinum]|uniref:PD-(D/E)XK nuclease family protein n=1 Tax=Novosphingobium aquimarinum TaxID=2682494 RepID=UPI0012EC30E0|nr:PD-(D/E)XK nuclease family protein [Novosphingobium aquimarinum]